MNLHQAITAYAADPGNCEAMLVIVQLTAADEYLAARRLARGRIVMLSAAREAGAAAASAQQEVAALLSKAERVLRGVDSR